MIDSFPNACINQDTNNRTITRSSADQKVFGIQAQAFFDCQTWHKRQICNLLVTYCTL